MFFGAFSKAGTTDAYQEVKHRKKRNTVEVIMKSIIRNTLVALFCFASPALAVAEAAGEGGSFLLTLFIGFFALIVVFQLVPATILFFGMLKGLFIRDHKVEKHLN